MAETPLHEALELPLPGSESGIVLATVGGGGKTTLLFALAAERADARSVSDARGARGGDSLSVLTTTTKFTVPKAAEGFPKSEVETRRRPNTYDTIGISNHCGGEAIDVTFPFKFNYYDPIVDALAAYFGLYRPVKDSRRSPEHWHYERLGISVGERTEPEPTLPQAEGNVERPAQ